MALFHTQNGSINLDVVRSINYAMTPEDLKTLQGTPAAEIILVTGELLHVFGAAVERLKKETNWTAPDDGTFEYVFEESGNVADTSTS